MNQSEFQAITGNLLRAWEKSLAQGAIRFASHWFKNWREIFESIISKRSNRNHAITFDSPLKTALNREVFILLEYQGQNRKSLIEVSSAWKVNLREGRESLSLPFPGSAKN